MLSEVIMDRHSSMLNIKSKLGRRNSRFSQNCSNDPDCSSGNSGMVLRSNLTCNFKRKTLSNLTKLNTTKIFSSFRSENVKHISKAYAVKSLFKNNQLESLVDSSGFKEFLPVTDRQNPKIIVTDLALEDFDDPLITTSRSEEEFLQAEQSVVEPNDCIEKSNTKTVNFVSENESIERLLTLIVEYKELKRSADLKWMQIEKVLSKLSKINNKENQTTRSGHKLNTTYSVEKLASIYTPNCKTPDKSVGLKSVHYTPRSLLKRLNEQIEDLNQT